MIFNVAHQGRTGCEDVLWFGWAVWFGAYEDANLLANGEIYEVHGVLVGLGVGEVALSGGKSFEAPGMAASRVLASPDWAS